MQRMGGGSRKRYTRKQRAGGNDPSCGCDMQAGWPKFLTDNIPMPSMKGGAGCGAPPIPRFYQGGGGCSSCSGLPLPQPLQTQMGGGNLAGYNSNPVPDACPFPGTGYCGFYARGGANYGEPMPLQAHLRGGKQRGAGCGCSAWKGGYKPTKKNRATLKRWRKGQRIGFTQTASLKAKGLIPRTSRKHRGKKVVSAKYK